MYEIRKYCMYEVAKAPYNVANLTYSANLEKGYVHMYVCIAVVNIVSFPSPEVCPRNGCGCVINYSAAGRH